MVIEEEDEEEVLEKGVSLKSILKNLLVIFLIIVGILIIYLSPAEDYWSNFMIGFTIICVASTILQIQKQPQEPLRQTLSILVCNSCGLTKVRNYESGDFIFKEGEKCEKCKKSMVIDQIYSVKLKQPTETEEKPKPELGAEVEKKQV